MNSIIMYVLNRIKYKRMTTSDDRATFINWWKCNVNNEWFYLFVKNNTEVRHLNFYSVFGEKKLLINDRSKTNVFFSGENLEKSHGLYDEYMDYCLDYVGLSLGFSEINHENYLRFPLWITYIFEPIIDRAYIKERVDYINRQRNTGLYDCSLIASHDNWNMRTPIYESLKNKINILCAGRWNNNTDILWTKYKDDKISFLKDCKFNICPENEDTQYYVTEKIFESFLAGSIPIYAGAKSNPEPSIINKEAVLLWDRSTNNEDVLSKIMCLLKNENYYQSFIQQEKLLPGTVDYVYDKMLLLKKKMEKFI